VGIDNQDYLAVKRERMGHHLADQDILKGLAL